MEETSLVTKNEGKKDAISGTRTLYDAGMGEIFWKNFIAGFGRGLGGITVFIFFILIIGGLFVNLVLPKLMPTITGYMNIFKSVGSISNLKPQQNSPFPESLNSEIQKLLGR